MSSQHLFGINEKESKPAFEQKPQKKSDIAQDIEETVSRNASTFSAFVQGFIIAAIVINLINWQQVTDTLAQRIWYPLKIDPELPEHLRNFNDEYFMDNYMCNPDHQFSISFISRDPILTRIDNFLAPGEAEHLQLLGIPRLNRSMVHDDDQGDVFDEARTSYTAYLYRSQDKVVKCVEERAAKIVNQPVVNMEPLQVVRYQDGQKYEPHFDYFNFPEDNEEFKSVGDRLITIFVYLTSVPEEFGGHTEFPILDVKVPAVKNSAALWYDMKPDGTPDDRTLHGGSPVYGDGLKFGLNIWIRTKCYEGCVEESEQEVTDDAAEEYDDNDYYSNETALPDDQNADETPFETDQNE